MWVQCLADQSTYRCSLVSFVGACVVASLVLGACNLSISLSSTAPSVAHTTRMASNTMAEKRDTAMIEDKDRDSVSLDKEALTTVHHIKPGMTAEDVDFLNNMPAREQARIYHKVDRRLVPMLALLYLIGMESVLKFGEDVLLTFCLRSE